MDAPTRNIEIITGAVRRVVSFFPPHSRLHFPTATVYLSPTVERVNFIARRRVNCTARYSVIVLHLSWYLIIVISVEEPCSGIISFEIKK